MPIVSVQPDSASLSRAQALLKPAELRQAIWQAVSRTTKAMEKDVERVVSTLTTLQKSRVKQGIKTTLTRGGNPIGSIAIRRRSLPASYFKMTGTKRGNAYVQFRPNAAPMKFDHGFAATVTTAGASGEHSGHKGLFVRGKRLPKKGPNIATSKMVQSGRYKDRIAARFTLREIFGPPMVDIVSEQEVAAGLKTNASDEFRKQLEGQIKRFLAKR